MEIIVYGLIVITQFYFFKISLLTLIGSVILIILYKIFIFPSKTKVDNEMEELRSITNFCNFFLVNLYVSYNPGVAVKETYESMEMIETSFIKKVNKIIKSSSSYEEVTKNFIALLDSYEYDFIKLFSSNLKVAEEKGIKKDILNALEESENFSEARYNNWLNFFQKKEFMWQMSIYFTFAVIGLVIIFSYFFKDVFNLFINNLFGVMVTELFIFTLFIPDLLASKSFVKKNLFEGVIDE